MSDADSRALVRVAEASGSGADWLRAAWALARERRFDEAGRAGALARAQGTDPTEVLEALTPTFDDLHLRSRAEVGPGRLSLAFAAGGDRVFLARRDSVVAIDVASGNETVVGLVPCDVTAAGFALGPLAPGGEGRFLAVAFSAQRGKWGVALMDLATGALSNRVLTGLDVVRSLSFTGAPGVVTAEDVSGVHSKRVDPEGRGVRGRVEAPAPANEAALRARVEGGFHRSLARDIGTIAPSPSGRLIAVSFFAPERGSQGSFRRIELVDARTGKSSTIALEIMIHGAPFELAWSPSGRKLAYATPGETLVVLDAEAPAPDRWWLEGPHTSP